MKLVFLIGNSAVGKMSVGQELMKITDLRLFHNHMTIELVIEIFGRYEGKAVNRLREVVFEEFASSNLYGLIFTYMWAFDQPADWDYVKHVSDLFAKQNAIIYYVELVTSQEIRLARNRSENRLMHKASKRDFDESDQRLLDADKKYRCESYEGEIPYSNYFKLDNTNVTPKEAALIIKERFML